MADVQTDPTTEPDELEEDESAAVPSWTAAPGRENGIPFPWVLGAP